MQSRHLGVIEAVKVTCKMQAGGVAQLVVFL